VTVFKVSALFLWGCKDQGQPGNRHLRTRSSQVLSGWLPVRRFFQVP